MPDHTDGPPESSQSRAANGFPVFSLNNVCRYCAARAPGLCAHLPMIVGMTNDTAIDGGGPACLSARRSVSPAGGYIWKLTETTDLNSIDGHGLNGTAESVLDHFALELARAEVREEFAFLRTVAFGPDLLHEITAYPTGSHSPAGTVSEDMDSLEDGLFPLNSAVVLVPTNPNFPSFMLRPTKALGYDDDSFEAWSVTVTTFGGPLDTNLKSALEAAATAKP